MQVIDSSISSFFNIVLLRKINGSEEIISLILTVVYMSINNNYVHGSLCIV